MSVGRWVRTVMVCLAALGIGSTARADVADYLGKRISAVSVQSEGRSVTDQRIVSLVETAIGKPLVMREVRDSLTHLFSLGQYEDVLVRASLSESGVSLTYDLVPLHPVEAIGFSGAGAPGIDEGKLRQFIEERYGRTPRAGRAPDMARDLESALRDAGYMRARVTPRASVEHAPERTNLTFAIEPGSRAKLGSIAVEGMPGMTPAELLGRLEVATGQAYEPTRINGRVERYLEDRRRKGFYEARLTVNPVFTDDDRTVNLRLNAVQGPLVKVIFEGDPVPADRRDELVPVAREGSADEDLLEDSTIRIEATPRRPTGGKRPEAS